MLVVHGLDFVLQLLTLSFLLVVLVLNESKLAFLLHSFVHLFCHVLLVLFLLHVDFVPDGLLGFLAHTFVIANQRFDFVGKLLLCLL